MKNLEELRKDYMRYSAQLKIIDRECFECLELKMSAKDIENEKLRVKRAKIKRDFYEKMFDEWKEKNDVFDQCMVWAEEIYKYCSWRDCKHKYRDLEGKYAEFINKINELNVEIGKLVAKNREIKRDKLFIYFDCPEFEEWRDHDEDWQNVNKKLLQKRYEVYKKSIDKAVQVRNELFEEKHRIKIEFDTWLYKNNLRRGEIETFKEEYPKWRGWDSSAYVYNTMIHSIHLTDMDEVNKIISNLRKIADIIIAYDKANDDDWGFDYEVLEFIDYLEIVNTKTRFHDNEGCMTTMALDIMENHYVYEPFMESFKDCISNICYYMDKEFRSLIHRMNKRGHELE